MKKFLIAGLLSLVPLVLIAGLLSLVPLVLIADGSSSTHAVITDGISNVIIGESLPYGNDAGWRKFYPSGKTIKAEEPFRDWNKFFIRCFLPGPIKDTVWMKHEKNAFAYFIIFTGADGKILQPKGKAPAVLYVSGERGRELSDSYIMRDSHGLSFDTKRKSDWAIGITQDDIEVDPANPDSLRLEVWNELEKGRFEPWNMGKDLKDALASNGGKITLRIYVKLYSIKDVKTMDVKEMKIRDTKRPWIVRRSIKRTEAPVYDEGKLIAKGEWTIVQ
jgi:hypothetical protein